MRFQRLSNKRSAAFRNKALSFAKRLLDRIEVRRIGRQVSNEPNEGSASGASSSSPASSRSGQDRWRRESQQTVDFVAGLTAEAAKLLECPCSLVLLDSETLRNIIQDQSEAAIGRPIGGGTYFTDHGSTSTRRPVAGAAPPDRNGGRSSVTASGANPSSSAAPVRADVPAGLKADLVPRRSNVRCCLNNGHVPTAAPRPEGATNGLMHRRRECPA